MGRIERGTKRKKWEELLERFKSSGLSGMEYAKQNGINYSTFKGWKRKLESKPCDGKKWVKRPNCKEGTAIKWVEATQEEEKRQGIRTLIVELDGFGKIKISDMSQVELAARLLKSLLKSEGEGGC